MEYLRRLQQQLSQIWAGMSMARRVTFLLVLAVSLGVMVGVGYWAAQPEYRLLYSGLAPEDAAAVTAKLQSLSVSYRLTSGGTTILVPAEQVQQLRLDLAAEGLPTKGTKGFEIFDEAPLGMTPFMQHVNYLRALQAELAKTIMRLEPVSQARVHLVRPEPSPFVREQKPTTASVVVWLRPGASLSRGMANGIVALVARSVEGLTPENVTLLDNLGHVLSQKHGPEENVPSSQLEYRREIETSLAAKAEEMLVQLLGPGRAVVRVTADVNFKRIKEKRETYSPEDKVVTAETVTNSKSTGSGPGARGIAGAASNVGTARGTPTPPTESKTQEEQIDTKYVVSKTIQEVEDRVGNVERLTVAAMVDLAGPAVADSGRAPPTITVKDAEEIIKQAVGFKKDRDEIKVTDVRLASAAQSGADAEIAELQRWQNYVNLARNASLGVAALIALLLGLLYLRRLRPAPVAPPPPEPSERMRRIQSFRAVAQQDPEAVARLLANWLSEPAAPARKVAA
jgi:flagellar M-ring protein FliF